MNIRPILFSIGLSKKEADVYLACLEHGPETITTIARLSGCKRSTLYHVIEGLLKKNFLVLVRRKGKTLYDAEKPTKLLTALKTRGRELERLLPVLEDIRISRQPIPQVMVYDGEEQVRRVYDEIYGTINNTDETCFLTSVKDLQKYGPYILEGFIATISSLKKYRVRELIYDDTFGRMYVKKLRTQGFSHSYKLLPADYVLHNDMILFDHKAALFSFHKRNAVTVIDDREVNATMQALFECAWEQGVIV